VPNSHHPHRFSAVGQLVENPVGPYPERVQAAEFSAQGIARERVALEQAEGLLDCVDKRPAQLKQVTTSAPSEDEASQGSADRWPAFCEIAAKLSQGERLAALDLGKALLQC
jgi:hypothetical protein